MIKLRFIIIGLCLLGSQRLYSQTVQLESKTVEAVGVSVTTETLMGKKVLRIVKDPKIEPADEPTYAKLKGVKLSNGTIEMNVLSKLLPGADPMYARGFIGLAFRINNDSSKFECFYIRPANGREKDPVRKTHAVQYISFPDYKFDKLRKENPGQYEAPADMGLNEWIKLKIVIEGAKAKIYVNNSKKPSLVVNDLKHGAEATGGIGLWVDVGTEGFFSDLKIHKEN